MANDHLILCGGVKPLGTGVGRPKIKRLSRSGSGANINLQSDQIECTLTEEVPGRYLDLLDIATYVYVADQIIARGSKDVETVGANWRRQLHFQIPVRQPDFWKSPEVTECLETTLGFLSDDGYHFRFEKLLNPPPLPSYFPQFQDSQASPDIDEVVLFSGGLDSLGGAVLETLQNRRRVALVTQKSFEKLEKRRRALYDAITCRSGGKRPLTIAVNIHKSGLRSVEHTQRSRSFLYASLGATVAKMLGLHRVSFYENGVVSLNLPISPQVVGSKATRTTHPKVLNGFARLFSKIADRTFEVRNHFIWLTKTDVVKLIADNGCADLVRSASSCTRVREMSKERPHCGRCSQCIDRRFAVLAAGLEKEEPAEDYAIDLLTGSRSGGESRTMISSFVETANDVSQLNSTNFFARFGEAGRALLQFDEPAQVIAHKIHQLYQRHGQQVVGVIDRAIEIHSASIRRRELPADCLLRLVVDSSGSREPQNPFDIQNEWGPISDFVFKKRDAVWIIRYLGGRSLILSPSLGAEYIRLLLSSPNTPMHVGELEATVAKHDRQPVLGSAGNATDIEAILSLRAEARNLESELETARALGSPERVGEILQKIEAIGEQLSKDVGKDGRIRKEADDEERMVKRVGNAIRRAVREIKQFDPHLASHLSPPVLHCGKHPCYSPPQQINWETE